MNQVVSDDITRIIDNVSVLERLRGKSILVTGAAGFIAAYMVEVCLALNERRPEFGLKLVGVVRNRVRAELRFRSYLSRPDFELIEADASGYVPDRPFDFIIHAASQASPKYYGIDPVGTIAPNVLGTASLLEHCRIHPIEGILFFSSGEVYGRSPNPEALTRETDLGFVDPLDIRSCYAESKRLGETLCVAYSHQYDVPVKIVRPFHTYGPGMLLDDGRVFADFVSCIVNFKNIVLRSEGLARRPFCYLSDAVAGFFCVLLDGEQGEAYNVGNPEAEISIRDLAEKLVNLYSERSLSVVFEERLAGDKYVQSPIQRNCPDISKVRQLGWVPTIGIEEGFRRTIASFEENAGTIRR